MNQQVNEIRLAKVIFIDGLTAEVVVHCLTKDENGPFYFAISFGNVGAVNVNQQITADTLAKITFQKYDSRCGCKVLHFSEPLNYEYEKITIKDVKYLIANYDLFTSYKLNPINNKTGIFEI